MRFFTFPPDSLVPTLLGWTPGLKSLVGGKVLVCGCLVGTYRTWRDETVAIVDARAGGCTHARHRQHAVLWESTAPGPSPAAFEEVPQELA